MAKPILAGGSFYVADRRGEIHLIVLDESKRTKFEQKLEEYKTRLGDPKYSPDTIMGLSFTYRVAIIEHLLQYGMVSPWEIMLKKGLDSPPYSWWFDGDSRRAIEGAVQIVAAYANGDHVCGGTGF